MESPVGSRDHRDNEFYSYRYSTRFQKGDIVEIRTGIDLEVSRFQARKSFPDVLNEYWWLKPSDVPALKELPLRVTDVYFYHGGVPVVVMVTANGSLARKTQVFLKKRDEARSNLSIEIKQIIESLTPAQLGALLLDHDLLVRLEAAKLIKELHPDYALENKEERITYSIINGEFDSIVSFGDFAVEPLVERMFVTSNAREIERIVDTLIAIGEPALTKLEDIAEYISLMASPYYAKRINWTIEQIRKKVLKNGIAG